MSGGKSLKCSICLIANASSWIFFLHPSQHPVGTEIQTERHSRGNHLCLGTMEKMVMHKLNFFKKVFFQSSFRFPEKLRVRYSYFPKSFVPTQLCHYQLPPPDGTFVTMDELTLTHHNHPKSIVDIRVHSWCCTMYGLGQMYNDMYLP